jgi:hypothetical protein
LLNCLQQGRNGERDQRDGKMRAPAPGSIEMKKIVRNNFFFYIYIFFHSSNLIGFRRKDILGPDEKSARGEDPGRKKGQGELDRFPQGTLPGKKMIAKLGIFWFQTGVENSAI